MGFLYYYNFNIRIIEKRDGDSIFSTEGRTLYELMSDTGLLSRNPVSILADPFLFVKDDVLYLFYECQCGRYGKGELRMRKSSDLVHWSEEKSVLREDFHLSFPNVFEYHGEVYMIPETGAAGSIRLYRAADNTLERWIYVRDLVNDGRMWADTALLEKEGSCYLFSNVHSRKAPEAHLFVSDGLDCGFSEHPESPYNTNAATARNAGRILEYGGKLYRPVQDCSKGYGKQISVMSIDELDREHYRESLCKEHIIDTADGFYRRGGHQFCQVTFKGRNLVATDAKQRNYNIREQINGYCHHICKRG